MFKSEDVRVALTATAKVKSENCKSARIERFCKPVESTVG